MSVQRGGHPSSVGAGPEVDAPTWRRRRSLWILRHPLMLSGIVLLLWLVIFSVGAPLFTPYDPIIISAKETLQPPSLEHPFGTDRFGRDQFSRILYGGRVSLRVGLMSVGIALALGVPFGMIAGYWRGGVDQVISRMTDLLLAFPGFLLALTIVFVLGPDLGNVMIAVGISSCPVYVRLARSSVLQVRAMPFVEAARSIGCSNRQIIIRHILPNIISPIVIMAALGLGGAILTAAGLSFLGAGAQPPTPEWGAMLNEGRAFIDIAWWLMVFPGLAVLSAVLAANLIGDGLRDLLDPRMN